MIINDRYLKGYSEYQSLRQSHWDKVALSLNNWKGLGNYYHKRLSDLFKHIIPKNKKVLEIGCGSGDLLASLSPSHGVGIDFSEEMCNHAKNSHPELKIVKADAHYLPVDYQFDYIILSDLLNDIWDVQKVINQLKLVSGKKTRVIINIYSKLWELPLSVAQNLGLAKPNLIQNWLSAQDVLHLLELEDFELIKHSQEIIFPINIPILSQLMNRFLGKIWPIKHLALTNIYIARLDSQASENDESPSVSIIIPARNEAGNIQALFERTPELGHSTELIFVEGHSQDDTYQTIERMIEDQPDKNARLYRQTGIGKGDAVRLGFEKATGDILMILDSDLSVPPEDLILFYNALINNKGDFINGVRLIYPMEDQAMRFLNLLGNKFFSITFSWLLDQPIKDTLCGTKTLYKEDYLRIAENRSYFGDFDPFGDFDLLFGAAKINLKIVDLPVRYRNRVYGQTNISRFRHGLLLLRMAVIAALKIKFI